MDWIIHIDTDELMHPSGSDDYSLKKVLTNVPNDVDMVIFPNYVSLLILKSQIVTFSLFFCIFIALNF